MEGKLQPHEFRDEILNKISPSFCATKFLSGTVWLGSGFTASCHHCPAHKIAKSELQGSPAQLFNTAEKKRARATMLLGERPKECGYCWSVEDAGVVSDRTYSSGALSLEDVLRLKNQDPHAAFLPKKLEIAFDRTCQFACSYCGPQYSTRWKNDIQSHGAFNIASDSAGQFSRTFNDQYLFENSKNPYVAAFWQWWPELKVNLDELRFTGGEPLLSQDVWKLIDEMVARPMPGLRVAVNTNLGFQNNIMTRFLSVAQSLPHLSVYTSCEAFGAHAEYIRQGLDFALWQKNVELLLSVERLHKVVVTMTVGALSLPSLVELLDVIVRWKQKFGRLKIQFSMNLLRQPAFQAIPVLPIKMRRDTWLAIESWLEQQEQGLLTRHEVAGLNALGSLLNDEANVQEHLASDFKKFFIEYGRRYNKTFSQVFPRELSEWFGAIDV